MPAPIAHSAFHGLIGVACRDITPPVGIYARNWGAAKHDVHDAIHRPFTCTALALRAEAREPPLILLALDLGWWQRREDEWLVRGGVIEALGLDESRLMTCISHTHSGPALDRALAEEEGGQFIAPYLEKVREAAIAAAREALQRSIPAELTWESGSCTLARNRDLEDPDKPRYLCGVNPAVAADDTVMVGRVCADDGRIFATVVNYACHPVSLAADNHQLSPDYIGAMRETVEASTKAPCLFLLGACGDLTPREQYSGDPAVADRNGRFLGLSAVAVLAGMLPPRTRMVYAGAIESGAPLAAWRQEPAQASSALAARMVSVEHVLKPLPSVAQIEIELAGCTDRVMRERIFRKRNVRQAVGDGDTAIVQAQLWRVGDAVLVGHPNEAYSHLQIELRRRHADRAVVVMNLCSGAAVGYLPPRELYAHDIYQVWQTPYAAGVLEHFIDACDHALDEMCAVKAEA
jgi:hypothetical protein